MWLLTGADVALLRVRDFAQASSCGVEHRETPLLTVLLQGELSRTENIGSEGLPSASTASWAPS